jgi:signal transduction histidine kinase
MISQTSKLEDLDREELIQTVRRLLAEADALSSRISAVNEIGIAINRTLDLDKIERVIARQAKWLLDFEHCSVCLRDGDDWKLTTLFGPDEPPIANLLGVPSISEVLKTGQPRLIAEKTDSPFLARYASQIIIPLLADDVILGTINFAATEPKRYTHDDMRIGYMLSLQLSSAIRNAMIVTELRHTQEELRLRVEELDAYGHTIAHDLKSPLASLMLRSELFAMKFSDMVPAEATEYVNAIHNSGQLMNKMIDQLLWLARLRDPDDSMEVVPIKPVVDVALARFTDQIASRKIAVTVSATMPDAFGHEQWVEEIFANLISNAIKYMGDKTPAPRIEISGSAQAGHGRYVVRDTGLGVKPEDQKRLFAIFSRLHAGEAEGLGLGLSIVHRIVKRLGGDVGVESADGAGSTFWFTLPLADADEQAGVQRDAPPAAESQPVQPIVDQAAVEYVEQPETKSETKPAIKPNEPAQEKPATAE